MDGTCGQKIQAHAAIHAPHVAGIHVMPAQFAQHRRTQWVVRHRADHGHFVAEMRQRYADVGFRTTAVHVQPRLLQQQLVTRRPQAQQ